MGKKIFVIIFGLLFSSVGVFLMVRGNEMAKRCTTEATGTIVEIIEEENLETDADGYDSYTYTYYPVIEYKAEDKTLSEKYSTGSGKSKYRVGDKVDILYDPNKPEDYLIKGDNSSNIIGIIFIVAGVVVTIIGVVKKEFN